MSAPPTVPQLDAANADPHTGTKYDFPRDLVGYGRHPPNAQWPGGAKIAVSFVINYEEVPGRTTQTQPIPLTNTTPRAPNAQSKTATQPAKAASMNKPATGPVALANAPSTSNPTTSTAAE